MLNPKYSVLVCVMRRCPLLFRWMLQFCLLSLTVSVMLSVAGVVNDGTVGMSYHFPAQ